jgi:hypothetical protein
VIVYNRSSLHYWFNQVGYWGLIRGRLLTERSMAGVLSRSVEYSSGDGRPLVRVYTPRQVHHLLDDAGYRDVQTSVRHFDAQEAFPTALLKSRVAALRDPAVLDRIGRVAGWYVVATGCAPD